MSNPYSHGQVADAPFRRTNPSIEPPGYQAFLSKGDKRAELFGVGPRFNLSQLNRFAGAGELRHTPASVRSDFSYWERDRKRLDAIRPCHYMAEETGIPYQSLIDLYRRDCAMTQRKLKLQWAP